MIVLALASLSAVTSLPSADGQFWDIQDTSPWAQASGGIATGGRANPFNGFGYLKLQVRHSAGAAPSRVMSRMRKSAGSRFGNTKRVTVAATIRPVIEYRPSCARPGNPEKSSDAKPNTEVSTPSRIGRDNAAVAGR